MAEGLTAGGTVLPCPLILLDDTRLIARFWGKVSPKATGPDGCWEWVGRVRERGYAEFRLRPSLPMIRAHRISFALHHGRWPSAQMMILHSCDNRRCVNPDHLSEGTAQENQDDVQERFYGRPRLMAGAERWRDGRASDTILRGGSPLRADQVRAIRAEFAGQLTIPELDAAVTALTVADGEVNTDTIRRIARGESWRWL